jgi:hypothetical protein
MDIVFEPAIISMSHSQRTDPLSELFISKITCSVPPEIVGLSPHTIPKPSSSISIFNHAGF